MKRFLFLFSIMLSVRCAEAQDSLHYDYARLEMDRYYTHGYIYYDDGRGGTIRDTVRVGEGHYAAEAEFLCFHYLNARGYELVAERGTTGHYIFQRKRK